LQTYKSNLKTSAHIYDRLSRKQTTKHKNVMKIKLS